MNFISAVLIAQGVPPFAPDAVAFRAGRLMIEEISLYAKRGESFGFGNVLDLPLEERVEMALKAAVEKVIVEHARQGLPIYIWRDSRVVEVTPEELRAQAILLNGISVRSPILHQPVVSELCC